MRVIDRPRRELVMADWKLRSADEADFSELVRGSCQVWDGGELKLVYLELAAEAEAAPILDAMAEAAERVRFVHRSRSDGLKTTSRLIGYRPRNPLRQNYCSATTLAAEQPNEHATLAFGARIVAYYYARVNPQLYARHARLAETRVLPGWTMEGTPVTSGIINRNNPLQYHFDGGNFAGVWSGMLAFKRDIGGGYLSIPEYDLALEIADRSLLLFDGQKIVHGVTPIRLLSDAALRHTIVYYSLKDMWNCLPIGAELDRLREGRTTYEGRRGRE